MHIDDILTSMRAGRIQSDAAIGHFVTGVTDGTVSRSQAAAWLAWAFNRGLSTDETVALTRAMTHSGDVLSWPEGPQLIDKHSTGGVGDKVSLILAPLWAELGLRVPMISGRGLGHTGGTLDKLESIPGWRCDLNRDELGVVLDDVGCFISGQTGEVAPADRVLYALRNETCTVESIPLIVGSILSKKLAAGVRRLVLDVKTGSGAFMKEPEDAQALARALVAVARGAGMDCTALITEMGRPLGRTVGNALEVEESIACLKGGGPDDLRELVVALADHPGARAVLASGAAFARFERMIAAQGGDLSAPLYGAGTARHTLSVPESGCLQTLDALAVGKAAFLLGAGRRRADERVDFGVGVVLHAEVGDLVTAGEPIVTIHHRDRRGLQDALAALSAGIVIGDPVDAGPLVHEVIGA